MLINKIIQYIRWATRLWHPFHKTAYLMGTPTHDNIGDIAIAVAEIAFLKKCGYTKIVNMTIAECWGSYGCIAKLIPRSSPIYFHGGGNMGDIYDDENLRRTIFPSLQEHKIIIFPQSIYYRDTQQGNAEKVKSIEYYNSKRMTIFARENRSFEIMKSLYKEANIILSPDIVLSMRPQVKEQKRNGILLCFRDDQEKQISDHDINKLAKKYEEAGFAVAYTSMIYHQQIPVDDWELVVEEKMTEIANAKLLVTDRLHGMIFAALTQTPCIVFGNNHHKVIGVYQWIKHLDYIRFTDSIEDAYRLACELYLLDKCDFIFNDNLFYTIKAAIPG